MRAPILETIVVSDACLAPVRTWRSPARRDRRARRTRRPLSAAPASGANGRIAFVSDRHGNDEILTAAPDGSDIQGLTATPQDESDPAFSPDGSRIAFVRDQDIWVMNADGSGQERRTGIEGSGEQSPAWSPDGNRIVFVSNRGLPGGGTTGPELWVMNADGSGVRRLTDTTVGGPPPAWSPTADMIAFQSNVNPGGYDLYAIAANATPGAGTDPRVRLTTNFVSDENPSWSPTAPGSPSSAGTAPTPATRPRSCGRWTPTARTRWRSPRTASTTRIRVVAGRHAAGVHELGRRRRGNLLAARRRRDRAEPHEHELRHRRRPAGLGRRVGDAASAPAAPAPSSAAASASAAAGHGAAADARLRRQGRLRSRRSDRLPHP